MDLFAKAASLGIQTESIDGQGHRHVTDAAALQIILDALPIEAPRRFLVEPVVVRSGLPSRTVLGRRAELPVRWKIVAAGRIVAEGATSDGNISWPADLPDGPSGFGRVAPRDQWQSQRRWQSSSARSDERSAEPAPRTAR